MTLDNEQQRVILLQLIDQATFPGAARKMVHDLGLAVETAKIAVAEKPEALPDSVTSIDAARR